MFEEKVEACNIYVGNRLFNFTLLQFVAFQGCFKKKDVQYIVILAFPLKKIKILKMIVFCETISCQFVHV